MPISVGTSVLLGHTLSSVATISYLQRYSEKKLFLNAMRGEPSIILIETMKNAKVLRQFIERGLSVPLSGFEND